MTKEATRLMAKRQRGGARPSQRAPLQRGGHPPAKTGSSPASPARPPSSLSDDELARAAELEAQIVAEERTAAASLSRGRDRRRITPEMATRPRSRAAGALTAVAEEELRYVVRDLRRIVVVFALIFGLLLASWLAIGGLGIIEL
jgi:hypothetical protein